MSNEAALPKALIFHGTLGSPQGNWFEWLQEELMMAGWQVAVPSFPTPDEQSYQNWVGSLESQIMDLADLELVIGHSLGATFALRLMEENIIQPKKLILVSAVIDKIENRQYDNLNASFIDHDFNWKKIKDVGRNIQILHGDNDPYVPLEQPEQIANNLQIPLNVINNGGHLNSESGYDSFPELLGLIHA